MFFYIGTMGFSYKDWNGAFYPAGMKAHRYLAYYSRIFNAVEVDSTFYGAPKANTVRHWAAATPDGFRFCLKVPRQITHDAGLVGVEADLAQFLEIARSLGEKLGVVLFQFPPSFTAKQLPALQRLLPELPTDIRFAVEIRDQSWYTAVDNQGYPLLAGALEKYAVCWAATEYPGLPDSIYPTSRFLYVRWIGQHGSYAHHDRERVDRGANMQAWWMRIRDLMEPVEALYGFFNNDYAGFAAGTANRFKWIAGLPVESFKPPQQGTLF
ncbi:MAG: DUF72 domain-containing protein [Anaerolineales bacterium]|nr:DUF72 domain-containing protein [Anaerolineales bacterium]